MKKNKNDLGRTLVEMLSTLAIMGVLSVVGIVSYNVIMNKKKATTVLNDARLVQSMHLGLSTAVDWTEESGFSAESQKTFYYKKDDNHNIYVKVNSIEEGLCQDVLNLISGNLKLYDGNNTLLTECATSNDIIFDFDNTYNPIISCTTSDDCSGGYCEEETCHHCDGDLLVNSDKTACICPDTMVSCSGDDGEQWCCGKNSEDKDTVCGDTVGSCQESDGSCKMILTQTVKKSDCSVSLTQTAKTSDCSMTFTNTDGVITSTQTGCDDDEYCYIQYDNQACSATISDASKMDSLYGVCNLLAYNNATCGPSDYQVSVSETGCPSGQYCYLIYGNNDCSSSAQHNALEIFGKCTDVRYNNETCGPNDYQVSINEKTPCPVGNYCYVNWSDNQCTGISSGKTGDLFGRCAAITTTNTTCTPK